MMWVFKPYYSNYTKLQNFETPILDLFEVIEFVKCNVLKYRAGFISVFYWGEGRGRGLMKTYAERWYNLRKSSLEGKSDKIGRLQLNKKVIF